MLNLFSSTIDEILQEIRIELKALTHSLDRFLDTNHTETEQAQAGYKEIRETPAPAIPDLPRIMPRYQDSLTSKDCHSEDRENFLCPTSGQQSDEDCLMTDPNIHIEEKLTALPLTSVAPVSQSCGFGLVLPKQSNHASSDLPADMAQTSIMSQTIQTNSVGFTPQAHTVKKSAFCRTACCS